MRSSRQEPLWSARRAPRRKAAFAKKARDGERSFGASTSPVGKRRRTCLWGLKCLRLSPNCWDKEFVKWEVSPTVSRLHENGVLPGQANCLHCLLRARRQNQF